jgi:hypothetical protein
MIAPFLLFGPFKPVGFNQRPFNDSPGRLGLLLHPFDKPQGKPHSERFAPLFPGDCGPLRPSRSGPLAAPAALYYGLSIHGSKYILYLNICQTLFLIALKPCIEF